jgi:hypothetical protein
MTKDEAIAYMSLAMFNAGYSFSEIGTLIKDMTHLMDNPPSQGIHTHTLHLIRQAEFSSLLCKTIGEY